VFKGEHFFVYHGECGPGWLSALAIAARTAVPAELYANRIGGGGA
jgi:hypothetical protein